MQITLEEHVPYDRSSVWRVHDGYFAERGIAAWTAGEVPYNATSNSATARQHARLFIEVVRELTDSGMLAPTDDVVVLEIGSGLGIFAANFLRELERCGPKGRAVLTRTRYYLSDYSRKNVEEATKQPRLARLVAAGNVIPAIFDMRAPDRIVDLDGKAIDARLTAVIANYVCDVAPLKILRKVDGKFLEKYARMYVDAGDDEDAAAVLERSRRKLAEAPLNLEFVKKLRVDFEWRPIELESALPDPFHAAVVRELTSTLESATVDYPFSFLDTLRALGRRLRKGGLVLVADFGTADLGAIAGTDDDRRPVSYGNALAHAVDFAVLDAFCAHERLAIERTRDAFLAVHTAAIRNMESVPDSFHAAFRRTHVRSELGQDLLDLTIAARALCETRNYRQAIRIYEHCIRLEPESPELRHICGEAYIAADISDPGSLRRVVRHLEAGKRRDLQNAHDFDFLLGAMYLRLGLLDKARRSWKRSLARQDRAVTRANLGIVYERLGQSRRAFQSMLRSLELDSESDMAQAVMARLVTTYLLENRRLKWDSAAARRILEARGKSANVSQ